MKAGRKPPDSPAIDAMYARRTAALAGKPDKDVLLALQAMVADFEGLKDTSELAARAAALGRDKHVRDALKKDRDEDSREQREYDEILAAEHQLSSDERPAALAQLRERWKKLAATADLPEDSVDRRIARRVLRGLSMGAADRVKDADYLKVVAEYRPARQR